VNRDPGLDEPAGLAAERTALAWIRTALVAGAVGLLIIRGLDPGAERALGSAAVGAAVLALVAVALARVADLAVHQVQHPRLTAAVGVSLLVIQAAGVWAVL
jgi:uncharacterized membrane protein YidH (DUF202 family)